MLFYCLIFSFSIDEKETKNLVKNLHAAGGYASPRSFHFLEILQTVVNAFCEFHSHWKFTQRWPAFLTAHPHHLFKK